MRTSKFVAMLAISTVLMPTLSACGGPQNHLRNASELHLTQEQLAQSRRPQRDIIIATAPEFDENGHMLPERLMTRTEAVMSAGIEQRCITIARDRIQGQDRDLIHKATLGSVILGFATGVGSLALGHGVNALRYGLFGAVQGFGSGAYTGMITVEQARSIAVSYCQIAMMAAVRANGDHRLQGLVGIPVVGMESERPRVNWDARTLSAAQRCLQDAGTNATEVARCQEELARANSNDDGTPPPVVPAP